MLSLSFCSVATGRCFCSSISKPKKPSLTELLHGCPSTGNKHFRYQVVCDTVNPQRSTHPKYLPASCFEQMFLQGIILLWGFIVPVLYCVTYTYTYTYTRAHARTHTHTHTHTRMHAHTHMHIIHCQVCTISTMY